MVCRCLGVNHMPICLNLTGMQMRQNHDGPLDKFSTSEDKMKFCLLCFSIFRTLIQTKGNFWNLQLCKVARPFFWHQEICGLRTQAIEHSFKVELVANQNVQVNRHGSQKKGCNQASWEFKDCDSHSIDSNCGMSKWQWETIVQRKARVAVKLDINFESSVTEWVVTLTRKLSQFRA